MLLTDAAVSPTVRDSLPVLRKIFVQEDDDSEPREPVNDAAKAPGRLVHRQLNVQQHQPSPRTPNGPKRVAEIGGFVHSMVIA